MDIPEEPARLIVNVIILIAPLAVGNTGAAPDGNRKYVLKPTVDIPELITRTVLESPSDHPVQEIVVVPVVVIL